MSIFVKILLLILVIIVIIALVIFTKGKAAYDKISFSKPTFQAALESISQAIVSGNTLSFPLPFNIKNDNNFSIIFSSINAELTYGGTVIGTTNDPGWHTIPANSTFPFAPIFNLSINDAVKNLLAAKIQGAHPSIDYTITLKVFGIAIPSITDSFTW